MYLLVRQYSDEFDVRVNFACCDSIVRWATIINIDLHVLLTIFGNSLSCVGGGSNHEAHTHIHLYTLTLKIFSWRVGWGLEPWNRPCTTALITSMKKHKTDPVRKFCMFKSRWDSNSPQVENVVLRWHSSHSAEVNENINLGYSLRTRVTPSFRVIGFALEQFCFA